MSVPSFTDGVVLFAFLVAGVVVSEALISIGGKPWAARKKGARR